MSKIASLGNEEFLLGFMLVGINNVYKADNAQQAMEHINKIKEDKEIGILVMQQGIFDKLSPYVQEDLIKMVNPAVVLLSKEGNAEQMRNMIIKSIGIDLWK